MTGAAVTRAAVTGHVLDRPVWSALATRQAHLAVGDGRARRMDPDFGPFAAAADDRSGSLAVLAALAEAAPVLLMEPGDPPPVPPGLAVVRRAAAVQMIAPALSPGEGALAVEALTEADGAEMRALALLTKPGPFHRLTHRLGAFVGVRREGRLVAMAGERLRVPGFTEVSGVCTHPDHRGQGYAAGLMRHVAATILTRGETPFLHSYADNAGALAVYARLGFVLRQEMTATVLARA